MGCGSSGNTDPLQEVYEHSDFLSASGAFQEAFRNVALVGSDSEVIDGKIALWDHFLSLRLNGETELGNEFLDAICKTYGVHEKLIKDLHKLFCGEDVVTTQAVQPAHKADSEVESQQEPVTLHDSLSKYYDIRQEEIGHGAYGQCFEGRVKKNYKGVLKEGHPVVVKLLRHVFMKPNRDGKMKKKPSHTRKIVRELRCLRYFSRHPNIIKFYDLKLTDTATLKEFNQLYIVMQKMDGDLSKCHLRKGDVHYTEAVLKNVMKQILYGVQYIHSAGYAHRDLKPQNILVRKVGHDEYEVKLCDFGLARSMKFLIEEEVRDQIEQELFEELRNPEEDDLFLEFKPKHAVTELVVTRWYRPPEVSFKCQELDLLPKIDVWSVGCIFAELIQMIEGNEDPSSGRREAILKGNGDPFVHEEANHRQHRHKEQPAEIIDFLGGPNGEFLDRINPEMRGYVNVRASRARAPTNWRQRFPKSSDACIEMIKSMLTWDPRERPTIAEVLNDPYFADCVSADDPGNVQHEEIIAEKFEGRHVALHTLREFVVEEYFHYNKDLKSYFLKRLSAEHGNNDGKSIMEKFGNKRAQELQDALAESPPDGWDVEVWLLGLGEEFVGYVTAFADNGIDAHYLQDLTSNQAELEEILVDIGIDNEDHRKKLTREIMKKPWHRRG